jgi:hypothetical protein
MNLTTTNQRGFALSTMDEAMRYSELLAKSQMVPKAYQGKPEDVLVAVSWGMELGLAPLQALQNIACINGKPSVYGDAAMALVQNSSTCDNIEEYFEGEGTVNPVAVCVAHRKNRTPVTAKFSVEDAKRAGLWGKQGPWSAYPKRMLQMRARGFAIRDAFPDVLKGLITVEEAQDFPVEATRQPLQNAPVKNPLDAIGKLSVSEPVVLEVPVEIPTRDELHDANSALQEASFVDADGVIEEAPTTMSMVLNKSELVTQEPIKAEELDHLGWELVVPGKESKFFADYVVWSEAYEDMAEKVFKYEKILPRTRMTKLRELREANIAVMDKIDAAQRILHTATYSKRLATLGAQMSDAPQGEQA